MPVFNLTPNVNQSPDYIVYRVGSAYKALTTSSGVVITDASIASLLNTIAASNTKIFFKPATFIFSASAGLSGLNNLTLEGSGWGTIFQAGTNLNASLFTPGGTIGAHTSGFTIRNIQADGNRANENGNGQVPNEQCLVLGNYSDDVVIENCYLHDWKTYGAVVHYSDRPTYRWNRVENCNGTLLYAYSCNYPKIFHNYGNGASDVGVICDSCIEADVSHNLLRNINLAVSPFGYNFGIGIFLTNNVTAPLDNILAHNIIDTAAYGIWNTGTRTRLTNNSYPNVSTSFYDSGTGTIWVGKTVTYIRWGQANSNSTGFYPSFTDQYIQQIVDLSLYGNLSHVYFGCDGYQSGAGTYPIYIQLYDVSGGNVVTGSLLTTSLSQYGQLITESSDILANLYTVGPRTYRVQTATATGGIAVFNGWWLKIVQSG